MSKTIHCDIVSAEGEIFSGTVAMVFVNGEMGELGIAPRHTPLLTRLKPGLVRVKLEDDNEEDYYVSGGLIEIQPHVVTVLADTAIRASHLDEAAAMQAKEEAERTIADQNGEMDVAQAQAKLAMAIAEISALKQWKSRMKR
ncbi:MAG: F0F1 ATP synthase subunit epsilon [Xanthomonadales bacterium]|nr:F0F1 ATP synthase subunit epsilon [Xanthomonadales bacterium]